MNWFGGCEKGFSMETRFPLIDEDVIFTIRGIFPPGHLVIIFKRVYKGGNPLCNSIRPINYYNYEIMVLRQNKYFLGI